MDSSKTVFKTPWFSVEEEYFSFHPAYKNHPFYRVNSPPGTAILPVTEDGRFVLVRQFRPSIRKYTLEFPSGNLDPGEKPEYTIGRELFEETGYRCNKLEFIGQSWMDVSRSGTEVHCFYGTGATLDSQFKNEEKLESRLVTPREFKELVLAGEMVQYPVFSIFALLEWKLGIRFDWNAK